MICECKSCVAYCESAGSDKEVNCKKYKPERSMVLETDEFYGFPERIVVRSTLSGKEKVFELKKQ